MKQFLRISTSLVLSALLMWMLTKALAYPINLLWPELKNVLYERLRELFVVGILTVPLSLIFFRSFGWFYTWSIWNRFDKDHRMFT
jgi:hypothetical protein